MRGGAVLFAALCISTTAIADGSGRYLGNVVAEWVAPDANGRAVRLVRDFAFQDPDGRTWTVPAGTTVDGASMPPVFESLAGPPLVGRHRRAVVLHEYFSGQRTEPWTKVLRMFHAALIADGVDAEEARVMYMAVYAQGPRWEPHEGSRCYDSCHAARASLSWRPVVSENTLRPVVDWLVREAPALPEIEAHVDAVTRKPGPHLFAQGH